MPTEADPIVENWYQHLDKGQKFQVVAVDEDSGLIEIQQFDGNVEEIDFDTWYELDIEPTEAPENWTGPMDDIEIDDLGYSATDMQPDDWKAPLEELQRDGSELELEGSEEEEDDWGEGRMDEEHWDEEN